MSATTSPASAAAPSSAPVRLVDGAIDLMSRIPNTLIAFIARFSIAAVFWKSGQTKVQGFAIDIVNGEFELGWPRLSDSAVALFQDEYKLPLIAPELAAPLAAMAEHVFPFLLLIGLAHPLFGTGAARHDARDPALRLSRCLRHAWHLGGTAAVPDGPRTGSAVDRPLAGAPPVKPRPGGPVSATASTAGAVRS